MCKNAVELEPRGFPEFEAVYTSDPMRVAQKVFTREQVNGSYRQCSVYKMLFGVEPDGQHTSEGDVTALERIVTHDSMCTLVAASARPLHDLSGKHLRLSRLGGLAPP